MIDMIKKYTLRERRDIVNGKMINSIASLISVPELMGIVHALNGDSIQNLTPKPDPLDESNKSPRIDCAGDRWAWSHRYERWVVTDVNTDNETNAEKRFDPAYPGSTFVLKLDTVIALNNWCGPLRFAVDDV